MNLHIFMTACTNESRLLKEAKNLTESGLIDELMVAALWQIGLSEYEKVDESCLIWRIKVKSRSLSKNLFLQMLKYIEWTTRIIWRIKTQKILIVHSHSLPALPVGIIIKIFRKTKLIYDAHELETEQDTIHGLRWRISRMAERFFIKFADAVIVVSDSISEWYSKQYGIKTPIVIRNIPTLQAETINKANRLREIFGIGDEDIVYISQGGIFPGRGVEIFLNIFSCVSANRHIIFMGNGPLSGLVEEYEKRNRNIHYLPAVPPQAVLEYTMSADVGICFIENICLSYYLSLPNKLFEYIVSGIPVIINDFPEQRKIVERYQCGWVIHHDKAKIKNLITALQKREIMEKKSRAIEARKLINWEMEGQKLLKVYKNLLDKL